MLVLLLDRFEEDIVGSVDRVGADRLGEFGGGVGLDPRGLVGGVRRGRLFEHGGRARNGMGQQNSERVSIF